MVEGVSCLLCVFLARSNSWPQSRFVSTGAKRWMCSPIKIWLSGVLRRRRKNCPHLLKMLNSCSKKKVVRIFYNRFNLKKLIESTYYYLLSLKVAFFWETKNSPLKFWRFPVSSKSAETRHLPETFCHLPETLGDWTRIGLVVIFD